MTAMTDRRYHIDRACVAVDLIQFAVCAGAVAVGITIVSSHPFADRDSLLIAVVILATIGLFGLMGVHGAVWEICRPESLRQKAETARQEAYVQELYDDNCRLENELDDARAERDELATRAEELEATVNAIAAANNA